jgi:hypothetical protein
MICCVRTGKKYGDEYVQRLHDGVRRHLPESAKDTRFVCFTNEPVAGVECEPLPVDLPKWWSKLGLYALAKPLLYFDLDIVILGSLQPVLEWDGFGTIKNPWLKGYNSSVIKLTGNEFHVWERFVPGVMSAMRGDQDWLNVAMPDAPTFPVEWFPSWKVHRCFAMPEPPPKAIAVITHGSPKPHQIADGWLRDHWIGTAQ